MNHEKPDKVLRAQWESDHEALSAMGKAGARKGTSHRVQMADANAAKLAEEQAREEAARPYVVNAEGDVLPKDEIVMFE